MEGLNPDDGGSQYDSSRGVDKGSKCMGFVQNFIHIIVSNSQMVISSHNHCVELVEPAKKMCIECCDNYDV